MNPLKPFNRGLRKNMQKATHPLVSVDSSNQCRRRGCGSITMVMVFVRSLVLFVWFLSLDLSVGLVVHAF